MGRRFLFIVTLVSYISASGCATVLGGQKTDHQRTRPECGQPRRSVRVGFILADLIFCPPLLLLDFATKKIYKPFPNENKIKKCNEKKR